MAPKENRLLIIGGTGRNVGKTEFICQLIKKISATHDVYALKVSTIFPDEGIYHGDHAGEESNKFLSEELRRETSKDTSRMLRAGAKRVFYLRSEDSNILDYYHEFCNKIPANSLIVCESNSLGNYLQPGLRIMVKSIDGIVKERSRKQLAEADLVIVSDTVSGFPDLSRISVDTDSHWSLKKE